MDRDGDDNGDRHSRSTLDIFWSACLQILTTELQEASSDSSLLRSVLVNEFPRLHTLLSSSFGHGIARVVGSGRRREFMKCVHTLQAQYLSSQLQRTQLMVQTMFGGAHGGLPTPADVQTMLNTVIDALQKVGKLEAASVTSRRCFINFYLNERKMLAN